MLEGIMIGLTTALSVQNLLMVIGGCLIGTFIGYVLQEYLCEADNGYTQFALRELCQEIKELDVNPLVVTPDDVIALQEALNHYPGRDVPIVAKIETQRAFNALPQILLAVMRRFPAGIMIARGDLAIECGWVRLAEIQEETGDIFNLEATPAEGTSYRLPTEEPGDYAIEVHDPAGTRLARLTYMVVGHGNLTGRLEKEAALQLKLDRSDYRAGDTIEMSITAPYTGTGLITIESDRVHAFKWFTAETTGTLESIRVPEDLEGNAYVCVSFVRDAGSKEIFTSPLSTAVAPFTIDRSRRRMEVSLEVDKRVRPGKTMSSSVPWIISAAREKSAMALSNCRTRSPGAARVGTSSTRSSPVKAFSRQAGSS